MAVHLRGRDGGLSERKGLRFLWEVGMAVPLSGRDGGSSGR